MGAAQRLYRRKPPSLPSPSGGRSKSEKEISMATQGFFTAFDDVWMLDGVRTPMVDYCGALGHVSPTDLGIKAAREALRRAGVAPGDIGSVVAGNMAPGDFDQFFLPRHIGLYAGVPVAVPAIMVQRICGTGFELFRQPVSMCKAAPARPRWWWAPKA